MPLANRSEEEQWLIGLADGVVPIGQNYPHGGSNPEAAAGYEGLFVGGVDRNPPSSESLP